MNVKMTQNIFNTLCMMQLSVTMKGTTNLNSKKVCYESFFFQVSAKISFCFLQETGGLVKHEVEQKIFSFLLTGESKTVLLPQTFQTTNEVVVACKVLLIW